ncbi:MAG: aldo/keto reductase [Bacteroidetes bacterium]|nr:aldo/keto reductase [Bacteroidota bacterium]
MKSLTRRDAVKLIGMTGLACISPVSFGLSNFENVMLSRKIPSSGEELPTVGLGTWIQFDVGKSDSSRDPLRQVLLKMLEKGGELIDSSPMYGTAENVVGDLTTELKIQDKFFYATKVWTSGKDSGINQMKASMRKMKRDKMDLMQIHNLVDWQTHLKTLRDWKERGTIGYLGITHYTDSSHQRLIRIIETEDIDFVQFNYSIAGRNAEKGLLSAAKDNGVAVIINRPYEGGSLFARTRGKEIPPWAKELDINSWGQFFLKFILGHEAVNCVIPGTSKPNHLVDNMQAGYGLMPDQPTRDKMAKYFEEL